MSGVISSTQMNFPCVSDIVVSYGGFGGCLGKRPPQGAAARSFRSSPGELYDLRRNSDVMKVLNVPSGCLTLPEKLR